MEAIINRPSLSALAGAVLGLCTGLALVTAGALNVTNATIAIAVLAALVWLLIPTSSRPASSVGDRSPIEARDSIEQELERWLASRAAAGSPTTPTDALAAEATRRFRRYVSRGQLVAAWERRQGVVAVEHVTRLLNGGGS